MNIRPYITCTECEDVPCWYLSVCLLDTTMSCAKMAEPVKMPFGVWTRVGPVNHVVTYYVGAWILPGEGAIFLQQSPGPL